MAERRYELIVFDWDGTLIDSAETIVYCIQESAREMALEVPDRARASHVIGLGLHDSLRIAVPDLPVERYREFAEHYRRLFLHHEPGMQLFDGVPELLDALCDRGHRLAVATGKSRQGLERALDASGLRSRFSGSRCGDETRPKPHPDMLQDLMRELSAAPGATLMVGDTTHDVEMAQRAGVDALAVAYGAHDADGLRAQNPVECVVSVEALRHWIEANA